MKSIERRMEGALGEVTRRSVNERVFPSPWPSPLGRGKCFGKFSERSGARGSIQRSGFTLIELLVVIAIIAILAALIIPITGALDKKKKIAVAQTQLKAVEAAIDGYKTKLGYYPPDNTNNPAVNPLYFELLGTTNDGAGKPAPTLWVTKDDSAQLTSALAFSLFSVQGLANTSTRAHSDDAGAAATTFITGLTPNQIGAINTNPTVDILVCSVEWPATISPSPSSPIPNNPTLNPWHYVSTHPTNNTSTYDLWVDVVSGKKTNRISNWSTTPTQL